MLTWAGYDDTIGGVERIVPSHCGQRVCPNGYTGAKCQQLTVDKEPPRVDRCPGDLWVIAKNGSTIVNWDMPVFSDNVGVTKVVEKSGHKPGQNLAWGAYDIAYIAYDNAGNAATCTFKVTVLCKFFLIHTKIHEITALLFFVYINTKQTSYLQLNSVHLCLIRWEDINLVATGVPAVNSKYARLLAETA